MQAAGSSTSAWIALAFAALAVGCGAPSESTFDLEGDGIDAGEPIAASSGDGSWQTGAVKLDANPLVGPCQTARGPAEGLDGADTRRPLGADSDAQAMVGRIDTIDVFEPPDGTLRISSQAQADQYACVSTIQGNLVIDGGGERNLSAPLEYRLGVEIRLPALARVTGNLEVWGNHAERIALPSLTRVEGDLELRLNVFRFGPGEFDYRNSEFEAPRLTSVGSDGAGTLTLASANEDGVDTGSEQWPVDFGLAALESAHTVVVSTAGSSKPTNLRGLSGLTRVGGDVLLDWPRWEILGDGLLQKLERIDGSLTIRAGNHLLGALSRVREIGGDFTLDGGEGCSVNAPLSSSRVLSDLAHVAGSMTIRGCGGWRCSDRAFPSLTRVDKTLSFHAVDWPEAAEIGALAVSVGSLVIDGSDAAGIFRHDMLSVSPGGSVQIANNPKLCQCRVDDFVSGLKSGGWSGTVTTSGNGECAPCPEAARCESTPL